MVRVKYRYILAEIVPEMHKSAIKLPLKENDLKKKILDSVQETHGDYGLACISPGFSLKMYNPATRVFILRVRRNFHSVLGTTLPLITFVNKMKLAIRTLHLSGTIRSSYKCLIEFDKRKLNELVSDHQLPESTKGELASMIEKCQNRLAKKRLDVK